MVQGYDSRDDSHCLAQVQCVFCTFVWSNHRRCGINRFPQGLQLARAKLSHEKEVAEAQERVAQFEARLKNFESQIGNVSVERVVLEEKPTKKSWWW